MLRLIRRWSSWWLIFPRRYIDTDYPWENFDLEEWSKDFEWELDPWDGVYDHAQYPAETVEKGSGDCVDYAAVAASYLYATTDHELTLCYHAGRKGRSVQAHMTIFDETAGTLYSSGRIREMTPDEYNEGRVYSRLFTRKIR